MAVTAWKTAGTVSNLTGVGTLAWVADDSGTALAGTEVSSDNNVYAGIIPATAGVSNYLRATNFGFTSTDIPVGSSIDGFEIEVIQFRSGTPVVVSTQVFLVKSSAVVGSNFGTTADWAVTETAVVYGSSTQLGGTSWSQSDVTSSGFGAALSVTLGAGIAPINRVQLVEQVRVRAYYTVGAAFDPKRSSAFMPWFL